MLNDDIALVTQGFSIGFDSPGFDVLVTLFYERKDPLTIRAYIQDMEDPSSGEPWIFGRDILLDGLDDIAGEACVTVRSVDDDFVSLTLSAADEKLEIFLSKEVIRFFVQQTLYMVPRDEEQVVIPDTVAELFGN